MASALALSPVPDPIAVQLSAERGKSDAQLLGRQRSAAVIVLERGENVLPFDVAQRPDVFRRDDQRVVVPDFIREIVDVDELAGRKGARAFHGIFELTDVAGPGISHHQIERIRGIAGDQTPHVERVQREECLRQSSKILRPLAKRRHCSSTTLRR